MLPRLIFLPGKMGGSKPWTFLHYRLLPFVGSYHLSWTRGDWVTARWSHCSFLDQEVWIHLPESGLSDVTMRWTKEPLLGVIFQILLTNIIIVQMPQNNWLVTHGGMVYSLHMIFFPPFFSSVKTHDAWETRFWPMTNPTSLHSLFHTHTQTLYMCVLWLQLKSTRGAED